MWYSYGLDFIKSLFIPDDKWANGCCKNDWQSYSDICMYVSILIGLNTGSNTGSWFTGHIFQ